MGILSWIIVGGLAGWIASMIMGSNDRQGCITDIVLGIVGACVSGWLYWMLTGRELRLDGLSLPSIGVALIGACIVIALSRALKGRKA